jgi:hypothetical protein
LPLLPGYLGSQLLCLDFGAGHPCNPLQPEPDIDAGGAVEVLGQLRVVVPAG